MERFRLICGGSFEPIAPGNSELLDTSAADPPPFDPFENDDELFVSSVKTTCPNLTACDLIVDLERLLLEALLPKKLVLRLLCLLLLNAVNKVEPNGKKLVLS